MLYKDNYLEQLIISNQKEWTKMMNHKFVKDIGNGNLEKKYFQNYLKIEHSFVMDAIDHLTMAMFYTNKIESKKTINKIINDKSVIIIFTICWYNILSVIPKATPNIIVIKCES